MTPNPFNPEILEKAEMTSMEKDELEAMNVQHTVNEYLRALISGTPDEVAISGARWHSLALVKEEAEARALDERKHDEAQMKIIFGEE